ncbi:thiamine pyrophosphate-binding protein [Paenibacillus hunanensis]|uniref:thiamine pyrophosphate-binding protein n=1 Tax=Paenibacillus hunanensis TaxID=539262 RepID=UPI002026030D|nr:thiamine pyrophosphate-binding protein [Paenibacillus hunanensis]MCL9662090.1 thiamine pyrophosphate-binding protein [Paenibacillus hunanensis]
MNRVADLLASHFKKWGITHVFGVPGKAVLPIIDAVDNEGIQFILSSQEGAAGFEAAGYAQATGLLGVCVGTSGPGGTNLVTAAAQAKASNLPILILTGHPSQRETGSGLGQDASIFGTNIVEILKPVTKLSLHLDHASLLERYLIHCLEQATSGVRGPVHLSIAYDVLNTEIEPFEMEYPCVPKTISNRLHEVTELIMRAKKPLVFAGKGIHSAQAYAELQSFVEAFQIPLMTTTSAKSVLPTKHPLNLGGFGLGGTPEADEYMSQTDLLIVLGTSMSDMSLAGYNKAAPGPEQIIQFDMESTFVGKSISSPTLAILGDLKANLEEIIRIVQLQHLQAPTKFEHTRAYPDLYEGQKSDLLLSGEAIQAIQKYLPDDGLIFGDCGSHTFYAIRDLIVEKPGSFIFDSYFGAMGHAIGYAVGAKLGDPTRPVICLTGDGCMLMHGTEISTAVNAQANVIFLVINNGRLDMVEKGMTKYLGKSVGTVYKTPIDAAAFGRSLGAMGYTCTSRAEVEEAFEKALQANHPTVIDIIVDPNEIPPTMKR